MYPNRLLTHPYIGLYSNWNKKETMILQRHIILDIAVRTHWIQGWERIDCVRLQVIFLTSTQTPNRTPFVKVINFFLCSVRWMCRSESELTSTLHLFTFLVCVVAKFVWNKKMKHSQPLGKSCYSRISPTKCFAICRLYVWHLSHVARDNLCIIQ